MQKGIAFTLEASLSLVALTLLLLSLTTMPNLNKLNYNEVILQEKALAILHHGSESNCLEVIGRQCEINVNDCDQVKYYKFTLNSLTGQVDTKCLILLT